MISEVASLRKALMQAIAAVSTAISTRWPRPWLRSAGRNLAVADGPAVSEAEINPLMVLPKRPGRDRSRPRW